MQEADTREREIRGILEASKATGCQNLLIITADESEEIQVEGKQIQVVPAWQWLLSE
jgi:predicted AAA+ superfamily ATPase